MTSREKGQDFSFPVGKTASGESGQNNGGLERGKGIGNFAEARARGNAVGQKIPARGSARFAGQGPCAQRNIFADLIFCFFLIKQKEEALPRRMSGPMLYWNTEHEKCQTSSCGLNYMLTQAKSLQHAHHEIRYANLAAAIDYISPNAKKNNCHLSYQIPWPLKVQ
ncbi:hypothetical protein [Mucilaginibacter aquariorum]|uniref:Uncharacterized protein n=1 Tax=Mucilaginibacter aquariorum TaxID=2967225 RepID=A0ABT1T8S3_9SPHI|nr:hypothetical protein [Mucilaginibacter aquariorum]MCQ6960853.1 hypothetical protein [Mucilaginibacter aquariorum]